MMPQQVSTLCLGQSLPQGIPGKSSASPAQREPGTSAHICEHTPNPSAPRLSVCHSPRAHSQGHREPLASGNVPSCSSAQPQPTVSEVSFPSLALGQLLHHRPIPHPIPASALPSCCETSQAGRAGQGSDPAKGQLHTPSSAAEPQKPLQSQVRGTKVELLQSAAISRKQGHGQSLHLINHQQGAEN